MPARKGRPRSELAEPSRVTYLVKRLELAIRAEMDDLVGVFGVTALQYTALSVLARHPGMSGAQLARRSFVSPQAGSEMVAVLERKGLIARSPHEDNRRILRIGLTSAGQDLLAACDEAVDGLEHRMLGGLSGSRVAGLRAGLGTCIEALGRDDVAEGPARTSAARRAGNGAAPRSGRRVAQKG